MTHYEVLEIEVTATQDDIKTAFRRLCKTHHPDAGGKPEDFRAISEAHEILSDPIKRKHYDEFGDAKSLEPFEQEILAHFNDIIQQYLNGGEKLNQIKPRIDSQLRKKREVLAAQINQMHLTLIKLDEALAVVSAKQKAKNIFKFSLMVAKGNLTKNLNEAIQLEKTVELAVERLSLYEFATEGHKILNHFHIT